MHELLARTIHEEYVRTQTARGETAASVPALAAWEQLPERYQESNRYQADHIGIKLAAIGCEAVPLTDWDAPARFEFEGSEIEKLAKMEHDRWFKEWTDDGWTLGPRAPGSTTNPYLVAWEDLPVEVQEWDRGYVRGLPAFLARAGLQIRRLRPDVSGAN
jgi:RyR domain